MGNIEYEGKKYDFDWLSIAILIIGAPLIAFGIWYSNNWIFLHEITSKITIWVLNLLSGAENVVYETTHLTQPWVIHLPGTPEDIHFETLCTGIHAIAIFVGVILVIPYSKDKETNSDIWKRKIIAILVTSIIFYVINIFRMVLQLYLYQRGAIWADVHYPISAASSFIAVACVLVMHKWVPEFIMSLIWIGDELKAIVQEKKKNKELLNEETEIEKREETIPDQKD